MAVIWKEIPSTVVQVRSKPIVFYVLLFLFGMVVLWTVLCAISHKSPDADNIEELVWASSFEWGYYKHPPVPSWFMYGLTSLFGKPVWLTFLAGELSSALALWFVWKLGCEFTTPRRALIATLMVSTTAYFSIRATTYNHNSAQLWSIVASTWLYYRALRYERLSDWLWLGAICGVAFITKYSALIQFAAFFLFFVWKGHWRERTALKGIALALLTFSVVVAPHIDWLFHHGFGPLLYGEKSIAPQAGDSFSEPLQILGFLNTQLGRLSPMLLAWLAVYIWNYRMPLRIGMPSTAISRVPYARTLITWDRSFLLIIGIGPVALTILVSATIHTYLGSSWASTFFVLFGFYTYWWLQGDERINLRRTATVVAVIHVLMAAGYAIGRGPLAYYTGYRTDSTFPGNAISQQMQDIWRQNVPGYPLTLVAADTWLGGNIAVHIHPSANVFIDGSMEKSPWLKSIDPMRCGMLVAYGTKDHTPGPSAAVLKLYAQARYKGVALQRWSSEKSSIITVHWAIIPPRRNCYASSPAAR